MKLAVLKETISGENRVAITPETLKKYRALGLEVFIEQGAGIQSGFSDQAYRDNGATIAPQVECLKDAAAVLKVQINAPDIKLLKENTIIVGLVNPYQNSKLLEQAAQKKVSLLSLEMIPRISRAQNMDVLSSQSNLAGYRAVIEASYIYGRGMPLMMTAAGTVTPAKVLILGAGVAGLQAIATARRMGAVVSAFDVRSAAREQVESLGAKFIQVDSAEQGDAAGGYAREMSSDYQQQQSEKIAEAVRISDIVITTALIPGKPAPKLVTNEMVQTMKPGSVIVDMATSMGGNCEGSKIDEVVCTGSIKIIGYSNLASRIAQESSQLFSRNIFNLINLMWNKESNTFVLNTNDEIIKGAAIVHNGSIDPRFTAVITQDPGLSDPNLTTLEMVKKV